jgi:hypothetical protein
MQNFDASHAKFRAQVGALDSTELTFKVEDSAIIPLNHDNGL